MNLLIVGNNEVEPGSLVRAPSRAASFIGTAIEKQTCTLLAKTPVMLGPGCFRDIMGKDEVKPGSRMTPAPRTTAFVRSAVEEHACALFAESPVLLGPRSFRD